MTARGAEGVCVRALVAFPDGADVKDTIAVCGKREPEVGEGYRYQVFLLLKPVA